MTKVITFAAGGILGALAIVVFWPRARLETQNEIPVQPTMVANEPLTSLQPINVSTSIKEKTDRFGGSPSAGRVSLPSLDACRQIVTEMETKVAHCETMIAETRRDIPVWDFAKEIRDESWAEAKEQAIAGVLSSKYGLNSELAPVECRRECCQIQLSPAEASKYMEDISGMTLGSKSSSTELHDRGGLVVLCFNRDDQEKEGLGFDREPERKAIQDQAAADLENCRRLLRAPVAVRLQLFLDQGGQITSTSLQAEPLGSGAACIEQALLKNALFRPLSRRTAVAFFVQLAPAP